MGIPETVAEIISPVVDELDCELVDVEWSGQMLRIVLDRPDGISTDVLAKANREISPLLDLEDPIPGRYTLEVSSPGVERPLNKPAHWERAIGEQVIVKFVKTEDVRRIRGGLVSIDTEAGTAVVDVVEVDGIDRAEGPRDVELSLVDSARTVFDWGQAERPEPKRKKKSSR